MMAHVAPDLDSATPILGRDRELAHLVEHLGIEDSARSRAVLLAGDAGVGKTRVLAELMFRAETAGWGTAVGHCLDFGDSALPYLPFSELFGRLDLHDADLSRRVVETYPALQHLQPGRRLLSGGASSLGEGPDRAEIFEAVHGALDLIAADAPLLVVVEDAHWADQSTRDLLSFLFTRPFRAAVSVVASYRSDDLHRRHPLRSTVAEWVRVPGVHRLQLPPLPDDDVRRLVRSLHGGDIAPRDLVRIVDRAEGNAFFAEELVAAELGAQGLPDDLADLLLVRLDRLDDQGRAVVRAAAVAGRRVSHELLSAVVDLGPSDLERALRAAVESHVLVQVGTEGYAFRHALLAEAVYDDLLPGERVRLHAAYADAIGSRRVDGTAAELARHARAAHDLDTALRAGIEAGDDAMSVGGPDEAAQHYETALELLADPAPVAARGRRPGQPRVPHQRRRRRLRPPRARAQARPRPAAPPPGRRARPPSGASPDGLGQRHPAHRALGRGSRGEHRGGVPGGGRAHVPARQAPRCARPCPSRPRARRRRRPARDRGAQPGPQARPADARRRREHDFGRCRHDGRGLRHGDARAAGDRRAGPSGARHRRRDAWPLHPGRDLHRERTHRRGPAELPPGLGGGPRGRPAMGALRLRRPAARGADRLPGG